MYKILGVVWVVALSYVAAQTQEELAQFVARQQTLGALGGGYQAPQAAHQQPGRRQAYFLPQGKSALQAAPQQQAYQIPQSKANAYQVAGAEQYYQPQQQSAAPQYYQPQQQYQQPQAAPARKLVRPPAREEEEVVEPPADYQFGFNVKDDLFTNYQKRKEQREGNKITGSYSVVDADGFIRTVTYTADPIEGFKADVKREPTDIKIRFPQPVLPGPGQEQPQYQPQAGPSARKQQTQQYLQAAAPQPQQYSLRPEQAQAYSGIPQGYSPQAYQQ